jgi:hypothetical protein
VNEIFDAISYSKGASVLRMIAEYIGETAMRTGLHAYLEKHKYKNAKTADLWRALSESSGKDVAAFMNRWVTVVGYPVVSVTRAADDTATFVVEQERFLSNGRRVSDGGCWPLALKVAAKGAASVQVCLCVVRVRTRAHTHRCDRPLPPLTDRGARGVAARQAAGQRGAGRVAQVQCGTGVFARCVCVRCGDCMRTIPGDPLSFSLTHHTIRLVCSASSTVPSCTTASPRRSRRARCGVLFVSCVTYVAPCVRVHVLVLTPYASSAAADRPSGRAGRRVCARAERTQRHC